MVRVITLALVLAATPSAAQSRRLEPAEVRCPSVLGVGVETDLVFCDVLIQREPDQGIVVTLPSHRGEPTLSFNLHNRHTYSVEEERSGRAFARYMASISVVTMGGAVLTQGVVLSEFRSASDLIDRVSGGAGPEGVKAVAPTGLERVFVTIPPGEDQVAIVGLSLDVVQTDSRDTVNSLARPVAVISDVQVEYRPR